MHLGGTRLFTRHGPLERQTAWVILTGAVLWGFLVPDRAFVMALYAGSAAFYLYRLSWEEPENRPLFLVLAGLMFGVSVMLRPDIGTYDPNVSLIASFGREAFRILCEIAVFYATSVGIMILRRSFLTGTRFRYPTSSSK